MITLLDLCAYLGLGAVGAATTNLLLGLLISMRYSPVRHCPHRRINLFALHQWTAYLAIFLTLSHPAVLLFVKKPTTFPLYDIFWPIHSYLQPKINFLGAIALYILVLVLISSLLRRQIGRPIWRSLHYLVFPAAVLMFIHSIWTDPNLKDGHPDLLDGGKVFLYIAFSVALVVSAIRIKLVGRGFRPSQSQPPFSSSEKNP